MAYQTTDQIAYTIPFKSEIQGHLNARFRLDADSKPIFERDEKDCRLRHYLMEIFLKTPKAKQIESVTYFLNDPSFLDGTLHSTNANNHFEEMIWSYGEVEVVVTVEMAGQSYEQRAWLSNMLENGHSNELNDEIRSAILRIKVS